VADTPASLFDIFLDLPITPLDLIDLVGDLFGVGLDKARQCFVERHVGKARLSLPLTHAVSFPFPR
jgi:hypothetical protein